MKIMHVDASAKRERSNSRALSRYFLERLREQHVDLDIDYLDVTVDTPPHVTEAFAIATYTPADQRTDAMKATLASSDALCERLLAADALVFAMPMYNWSMPSAFKAFIDSVTRTNLTYVFTDDGHTAGQLGRQKVLFITSRGADLRAGSPYAAMDALTPALKAAFGFLGVADPTFVDAQPLQFADPEARTEALERAHAELDAVAVEWAKSSSSVETNDEVMTACQE
ncbi:FMN-dependent NADH-azoreductase [Paraburkholderia metrosideri]|jgi:FMN-dependent NADH-azoreductase|uniref:FMN dependent NADH:quinone oxidoreductase n=1 Tax=Paraburkholderia metrosideri TaxID=580937 RepID=A0ABM8NAP4_9BURK|nr:NAD(P)H-dependent oxidoreductase [Paraburkholderia metrosideri]CAD6511950.1 FMN-dependent NADH-azoreductase [Paraburkholderia metrosideri]